MCASVRKPAKDKALILALDTVDEGLSLGLFQWDGSVIAIHREQMLRGQAEHFLPALASLLDKASASRSQIKAIVVANGPGNFTGIRIGLSVAKGLGLGIGCPVYGVSHFQRLATALDQQLDVAAYQRNTLQLILPGRGQGCFAQLLRRRNGLWVADGQAMSKTTADVVDDAVRGDTFGVSCGAPSKTELDIKGIPDLLMADPSLSDMVACFLISPSQERAAHFDPHPLYVRAADAIAASPLFSVMDNE